MIRAYPPAIVYRRKTKGHGHAYGPVVIMPQDGPAWLLDHELHHVKQWWAVLIASLLVMAAMATTTEVVPYAACWLSIGVYGFFYRLSTTFRFIAETAAYGHMANSYAKHTGDAGFTQIDKYAGFMTKIYGLDGKFTEQDAAERINRVYYYPSLF